MGKYENNICQAVEILVNQAISNLRLDKTVLATIQSCEDEGLGEYRVKYQDSIFTAYAQSDDKYRVGTSVYVLIPSNDTTQNRLILGSIKTLGENYIVAASPENNMTKVGPNLFHQQEQKSLCSYKTEQFEYTGEECGINKEELTFYQQQEDISYIILAANFKTSIPDIQKYGNGDYGIIITCEYFNNNLVEKYYERNYIIHVPTMLGRPYYFSIPTRQYSIFGLEDKLTDIKKVTLFTKDFPYQIMEVNYLPDDNIIENTYYYRLSDETYWMYKQVDNNGNFSWVELEQGPVDDIFISNFELYFAKALTNDEIAGSALKITTPITGSRFTQTIDHITLNANVLNKGSLIQNTDNIKYYWFIQDLNVNKYGDPTYYENNYCNLGGEYWRCLNEKSSTALEGDITFQPDSAIKELNKTDCPASTTSFKCVAVLNEFPLDDTIIVTNEDSNYTITLTSKYGSTFSFDNYNSIITATVKNRTTGAIVKDCHFTWGYETDDGSVFIVEDNDKNILQHQPYGVRMKYIVTVTKNNNNLGGAEIILTNQQKQQDYLLNIINGNQVFKYTAEGYSPTRDSLPDNEKQIVNSLDFVLYDKDGNSVGQIYDEYGDLVKEERVQETGTEIGNNLLNCAWLFPKENTMLIPDRNLNDPDYPIEIIEYNGIEYYKLFIYNQSQLKLNIKLKDGYNDQFVNNDIMLEVKYKDLTFTTSTNFTVTKEGQLGTNGTRYTARLVPQDTSIKQVYVRNRLIKSWKINNTGEIEFNPHSTGCRFQVELWDGSTQPISPSDGTDQKSSWELIPKLSENNLNIECEQRGTSPNKYNIGLIKIVPNKDPNLTRTAILQACVNENSLTNLANKYYASYTIPVMKINSIYEYIVTGGFTDVQYAPNGERSSYITKDFVLTRYNTAGVEVPITDPNNITWIPSWENKTYRGSTPLDTNGKTIKPPEQVQGLLNNYITIKYGNDTIIWSLNFYFNRYSMTALNGWDGAGVEIEDGYILTPQLAAGVKNHNNNGKNQFTGIAIGTTFEQDTRTKKDIGLFGYKNNDRTIFLDAQTGTATFGTPSGNNGCLIIKPSGQSTSTDDNSVDISLYGSNPPTVDYSGKVSGGNGAGLKLGANDSHLFFEDKFFIYKNNQDEYNVYLNGTVYANAGKIGNWKIDGTSLIGTKNNNTIKLDLDGNDAPSITGGSGSNNWYIKGNGGFRFGNSNSSIAFEPTGSNIKIKADLEGTNWNINKNGNFKLANGALGYNMDADHPGFYLNATEGKITLGKRDGKGFQITFNGTKIQGEIYEDTVVEEYGYLSSSYIKKFCGFAYVCMTVRNNTGEAVEQLLFSNFPKSDVQGSYIYGSSGTEDNKLMYKGWVDSSGTMSIRRVDGNKIGKDVAIELSGMYPQDDPTL